MDPHEKAFRTKNKWESQRIHKQFRKQGILHRFRSWRRLIRHTNSAESTWKSSKNSTRIKDFNTKRSLCRNVIRSDFDDHCDSTLSDDSEKFDHDILDNKSKELTLADYLSLQNKEQLDVEGGDDQNEELQCAIQLSLSHSERTQSGIRKRKRAKKRHHSKRKIAIQIVTLQSLREDDRQRINAHRVEVVQARAMQCTWKQDFFSVVVPPIATLLHSATSRNS